MTTSVKRKVSVTLDDDLVAEVERRGGSLSSAVNAALRAELERARRHAALGQLLDRLVAEDGPLDSGEDQTEIARFVRLLGGASGAPLP